MKTKRYEIGNVIHGTFNSFDTEEAAEEAFRHESWIQKSSEGIYVLDTETNEIIFGDIEFVQ